MFLRVHVHARDKNTVDALERRERVAALRALPDGLAGDEILAVGEDERNVEVHPGGSQRFERIEAGIGGGDLDQAVLSSQTPLLPKFDVPAGALGGRRGQLAVFQQRIQLEADVTVVALRCRPDGTERCLRVTDQLIRERPSDALIGQTCGGQLPYSGITLAGLDDVGDDDWIRSGSGCPEGVVLLHLGGINRVQPEFCSRGDERLERHGKGSFFLGSAPGSTIRRAGGFGKCGPGRQAWRPTDSVDAVPPVSGEGRRPRRP